MWECVLRKRVGAPLGPEEERANEASVRDLARRIENFRIDSIGGVFALVGPWGSGKTSLADAATARLAKDHGWRIAAFEPWAYGDYQSMLDGFFRTLRNQLGAKRLDRGTRKTLSKFFQSVAPFGSIGGVFGVPLQGVLSGLASVSSKREDFLATRAAANEIFSRSPQPILIVIEDIDRLDSSELMNCFKLIRLLGELDNVYYLLCYDEQTVVDVMQKTDVIGTGGTARARAYLEKITQVRVDVLDLYGTEQKDLWDRELRDFIAKHELELWSSDWHRLDLMWDEVFKLYLRSPRALTRFSLQLSSMWQSIAGEVNFPDFVAITFFRTFETEVFFKVRESRKDLVAGEYEHSGPSSATREERRESWAQKAVEAKAKDPKKVVKLLGMLFAGVGDPESRFGYLAYSRSRNIDSSLYFDRYFRNSLAGEDIPERSYRAYLDDTATGEYCDMSTKVLGALSARDKHVWERLEGEVSQTDMKSLPIIQDLQNQYGHLMAVGGLSLPRDHFIVRLALKLERGDSAISRRFEWYEEMAIGFGGVALLSELFLEHWESVFWEHEDSYEREMANKIVKLIQARIADELQKDPDDADHSVLRGLMILESVNGTEETRTFFREALTDSPSWNAGDALTSFLGVEIEHTAEGPNFSASRYSLRPDTVDHYLGFDWTRERLNSAVSSENLTQYWSAVRPAQSDLRNLAEYEVGRIQFARASEAAMKPAEEG